MLRWTIPALIALCAIGPARAADLPDRSVTIYRKAPPAYGHQDYGHQVYVEEDSDLLFTPSDGSVPYVHFPPRTPQLPGSATLPGYYGSTHSYDYQGPYYGGPNIGFWNRLPYACGVYGYC